MQPRDLQFITSISHSDMALHNIAVNALMVIMLIQVLPGTRGCTVSYVFPELVHAHRTRTTQITSVYLATVGEGMYPRLAHLIQRYCTRIPCRFLEHGTNHTIVQFPEQNAMETESMIQIYRALRTFYGILHNMEEIETDLHFSLYITHNFKHDIRIMKRMILTPILLLQSALLSHEQEAEIDLSSSIPVNTVCNSRHVASYVSKSVQDLENMKTFFIHMANLS